MSKFPVHVAFPGRLVFVGFGSIGQGVLPLILRHIGIKPDQITVVAADEMGEKVASEYGVRFIKHPLTRLALCRSERANDWVGLGDPHVHGPREEGTQRRSGSRSRWSHL